MTSMIDTGAQPRGSIATLPQVRGSVYRLEGDLSEIAPIGAFADGIRFKGRCAATVVSETPRRVSMDVYGLVSLSDGSRLPSAAVIGAPGFDFPDLDLRLTGSAYIRSTEPQDPALDGSVVAIEGWVNFESGELWVETRAT